MAKSITKKTLKIKIVLPVSGKYSLSASVGDEVLIDANKAQELIDDKYAILVK